MRRFFATALLLLAACTLGAQSLSNIAVVPGGKTGGK